MEDLSITIKIAGRQYRLKVNNKKDEEQIFKAVEEIKKLIKAYADKYAYNDNQDLLAMVTLQQTISSLENDEKIKAIQTEMDNQIEDINKLLNLSTDND
jgi:cell division protein ZapA (FtsZ GTPase activity inhibitor)